MKLFIRLACTALCLQLIVFETKSQCLIPADTGDTLFPVINRMYTFGPFGASPNYDRRQYINKSAISGNTMYVGGSFQYIGPNTGTGIIMNQSGDQIITPKKWRINGPVFTSLSDSAGGYYIGGAFTRIGDSTCYNIAHINSNGEPYGWKPQVNDIVQTMVIYKDTLVIGGSFGMVDGQTRNGIAMFDMNTGSVLPASTIQSYLTTRTVIHTFELSNSILYVGGTYNVYNNYGSFFAINLSTGVPSALPAIYQLEDVYTLSMSADRRRIYMGGRAGGSGATSNGFCMDANNHALLYKIDVGVQSAPDNGRIYSIKTYGKNVYVGGLFDFGIVNGNNFNQKGLIAFDTTTGTIRNYLNNCDGFISSITGNNGLIYIGGQFTSIGGQDKTNFALFDTTSLTISSANSLSASDQIKSISFSGSTMFAGGFSHSWGCVKRNGLAAFDINTGEIKPWQPTITVNELNDIKIKGDTVFMAGNLNGFAFAAINAVSGNPYPSVSLSKVGHDLLFDGDYLYIGGASGHANNANIVKVYVPNLTEISSWSANPGFDVKSLQKKGNKIYATGDNRNTNLVSLKGFIAEIMDNGTTGTVIRSVDLTGNSNQFYWMNSAALAGNKLFITGSFSEIKGTPRSNFAAIDLNDMTVTPIDVKISTSFADHASVQFLNGHIYLYGSFQKVNNNLHKHFAVIDTTVGAVFPDNLHLNNDAPFGYSLDDFELYSVLNTIQLYGDKIILGGDFRNVNQKMFPSLAKLQMVSAGVSPSIPQGISGADSILCPSQSNLYTIINSDPKLRYAWFYSGTNVTIRNNGTDSVLLDVGPLATPGQLKAVAINECGKSDTAFVTIAINTIEPDINASNIMLVHKTDTTATVRFTPGDGARRIIVIKALNTINDYPHDTQEYNADNIFGLGSNLGNNTFVVHKGSGDSVVIKGLNPETLYYVTVFEFNGINANTNYLTTGNPSLSFTTLANKPSLQASNIVVTNVTQTSLTINCTPGNGTGRLVVLRLLPPSPSFANPVDAVVYSPSSVFGDGSNLGNGNYVVSLGTLPVSVTNLQPGALYGITVFEYNGNGEATTYMTTNVPSFGIRTIAMEPTIASSNITVSDITNNTATINCTPGNGQWRLVVMRKDNPVTFIPRDSVFYDWGSSNAIFDLGPPFDLGGNTYVLNSATPIYVSNLKPNTVYHIAVFEFNGYGWGNNYLTAAVPTASFRSLATTPTLQANNLSVSDTAFTSATVTCTSGNGANRLFVIKAGSSVVNNPVNGVDYTGNRSFGQGSDIGNNTYVIGNQQPVNITNLTPGTTYYLKVFEYNGSGSSTKYLITGAPAANFTTTSGPLPVSLIYFNCSLPVNDNVKIIWGTSMEINCSYFTIERSFDGNSFTAVATVNGNGTTFLSHDYSVMNDVSNVTSPIIYYRLKQVDGDGKKYYSKVIILNVGEQTKSLLVSPNPFKSYLNINLEWSKNEGAVLNVLDAAGKKRLVKDILLVRGYNNIKVDEVHVLLPGVYILQIISSDKKVVKKIIK